jgi:hypothetical protein
MGVRSAPTRLANRAKRLKQQIRRAKLWIAAYLLADQTGEEVVTPFEIARKRDRRAEQRHSPPSKKGPHVAEFWECPLLNPFLGIWFL